MRAHARAKVPGSNALGLALGVLACSLGCSAPDPRALALPTSADPLTYVVGLFSQDDLVEAQVSGARPEQLPFWDDASVDRVEIITLGAAPAAMNLLEGSLSLSRPAGPATTLAALLDRVAERVPATLYTWTATEAGFVPRGRAPSLALLEAYVPQRSACPPIERRVIDSTVAVDLVSALLVTRERALLHGVERATGEARFGYATRAAVRWTSRTSRPVLGFGRGLGSKAIALVDEGEGRYALLTVDYEGRTRGLTLAVGAFDTTPALATTTVDPAIVYTPGRIVEAALGALEVRDVTASWRVRPTAVALGADASRDPPLLLAVDARTDVWRRQGVEWVVEDNLAPSPEGITIRLATSRTHSWAIDGSRAWARDDAATRWRRADPPGEVTRTLAMTDETRAVAVVASGSAFVHDGSAWCQASEPLDRPHELLAGGFGEVIARVRLDGPPAGWALAWWSP